MRGREGEGDSVGIILVVRVKSIASGFVANQGSSVGVFDFFLFF